MTVHTTDTKARRQARGGAGLAPRPRPEHSPRPERNGQERNHPARAWHDRDLPIAGTRPRRSSPAGDVVLAYLRTQAGALKSLEPMVRADEFDAVHQMPN